MASSSWCLKLVLAWSIVQMSCPGVHGYCMSAFLVTEPPEDPTMPGPSAAYCLYNGIQFDVGTKIRIRSECLDCSCDGPYMDCCGFGIAAGVFGTEDHCKVVALFGDCVPYNVRKDNETADCRTGKPIVRELPPPF